jgi:hypothetical protein
MIKKLNKIRGLLSALLLFSPLSVVHAAIIDVSSLSVDYVTSSISISDVGSSGVSSAIVPPAEILMGVYQDPILAFSSSFSGGSFSGSVYSTGAYSDPAPSASVDTLSGTFNDIDLSSLRLSGTMMFDSVLQPDISFDTEFWPQVISPTSTMYDHATGDFSLSWAFTDMVTYDIDGLGSQEISTAFDFTISGSAVVVPVPAAVWLFGSGLIALVGVINTKRKKF